jgi:uncharacterized protein (DUF983 family)
MKTTFRVYLPPKREPPPPPPDDSGDYALLRNVPPGAHLARLLVRRALARRCPVCGEGRPFASWLRMKERCEVCGYHFEREPGYWIGAMTINYGVVAAVLLVLFVALAELWRWPIWQQLLLWGGLASAGVLVLFPYSRLAWVVFDLLVLGPPRRSDFPPPPETDGQA